MMQFNTRPATARVTKVVRIAREVPCTFAITLQLPDYTGANIEDRDEKGTADFSFYRFNTSHDMYTASL